MTRFDPNKQHKSAVDWSVLAYKTADDDKAAQTVVLGLAVGVGLASASPIVGGLVGLYFAVKGFQKACNGDKNKKYIREMGCVAHVLEGGNFRAYLNQAGSSAIAAELEFAEREGLAFSNEAIDWWEDYQERPHQQLLPAATQSQTAPYARPQSGAMVVASANSIQSRVVSIDVYDPLADSRIDIISEMVDPISNVFIVGLGGSGKGMLLANGLREVKQVNPNKKIFLINGKDDPKERGYFDGVVEVHKAMHCESAKPQTVAAWFEACVAEYDNYAVANDGALLVIDEGTIIGARLKTANSTALKDKLIGITSCGGSTGKNLWFVAQTPYVGANGSDLSAISQLTPIAIVSKSNLAVMDTWKKASLFKKFDTYEIAELVQQSECDRAVYFGKTAQWYSMPSLNNYSGYDRDRREYLPGFTPHNDEITSDLSAVNKLEDSLYISEQPTTIHPQLQISSTAQLVLDWLHINRQGQWIKYKGGDRDQSFINIARKHGYTSTDAMVDDLFVELLLIETIDIDEVEGAILVL